MFIKRFLIFCDGGGELRKPQNKSPKTAKPKVKSKTKPKN